MIVEWSLFFANEYAVAPYLSTSLALACASSSNRTIMVSPMAAAGKMGDCLDIDSKSA